MADQASDRLEQAAAGEELAVAALEYAAAGLPVLPLSGKLPRIEGGLTRASADPLVVAEWWRRWPAANVGIRTGAESGLVVVDVDTPKGGAGTLERLEREHGKLPATARVLTGGGGWHIYLRHPGQEVRNSAGKLGAGLDVRGDGGYVVAPPSLHESGRRYKWTRPLERGLADPPGWLLADAGERRNGAAAVGETIAAGERNETLASLAGSMRRRGMGQDEILAALRVTNKERCRPPLDEDELERIAGSVARYDPAKRPREPLTLDVLTAHAVTRLPDPPGTDELCGPLVVAGQRLIVGGHTGEGKTSFALQLVRAVTGQEPFLDWQGAGGRALVLDAEQGLKTVKRRLREAGLADSEAVDYVRVPDGLSLDSDEQHVAEVERVLAAGGYRLVVADPLYKLHSGDSNAEREAVDLMRRLDGWRERHRFALVLPVHCRKPVPGTRFSIHDLFGSSAYVRGAEVVLGLQRVSDGYAKLHFLKDRDGDLPISTAWGLLFDREQGFRRDPNDGRRETAVDKVRALLAEDPTLTPKQLEDASGYAERTVRKALHELRDTAQERLPE
jgi:hypothetical protein